VVGVNTAAGLNSRTGVAMLILDASSCPPFSRCDRPWSNGSNLVLVWLGN
jgi:hypothetical protein